MNNENDDYGGYDLMGDLIQQQKKVHFYYDYILFCLVFSFIIIGELFLFVIYSILYE